MLGAMILAVATMAHAATIITNPNSNGVTDSIFGINASSTGDSLAGLLTVTVFFTSGANSGPIAWTTGVGACTSGVGCGLASGAVGNGAWTLTVSGSTGFIADPNNPDTSAQVPWTLTNSSSTVGIASVLLNGVVSNTRGVVFDRDFLNGSTTHGAEGTPGGAGGVDFTFVSESGGNTPYTVTAQYSNIAALVAAPPCRDASGGPVTWSANTAVSGCQDEWGTLAFSFSQPFIATTTSTPTRFAFYQDTDEVTAPEPVTFWLIGGGLAAFVAYRRRRASV